VGMRLGIPETKVRAEARAGRFPHHKIGRYRRFSADQVEAYLRLTAVRAARDLAIGESSSRRRTT
jgi:excisionase family DNA binding protein